MAFIVSTASGNFNVGATWVGGIVPGVGDEAQAATGHTITITANATCTEISNAGTGIFTLNDGITLTANVTNKSTTVNRSILQFTAASPAVGNIVGDVVGQATSNSIAVGAVVITSSGTLNVTGNVTAGAQQCVGVANTSTGTLNVTGNVTAGSGNNTFGASNTSTGVINITGNVLAGTGQLAHGANNGAAGTINITGNCTARTSTGFGAFQNSTGTLSVIGTIQATQTAAGVAGASVQQTTILSGPFLTETVRGVAPVYCAAWRWNASPSNSTYMEVMTNNLLAKRNLVTADNITGMPAANNVKSGIAYGPSNELTGTFSQTVTPSTADIATAVWGAATRTITGGTVDTLTNAPSVPSAATIASQVRTELGVELGRLDASVSSRLAPSGTLAAVTNLTNAPASVTPSDIWSHATRTLTTSSGPTAVEIRQEIDANSTKLDAAVSSRMAASEATKLDSIKGKTDLLNTDRLSQVATTNIVGVLLAQANS